MQTRSSKNTPALGALLGSATVTSVLLKGGAQYFTPVPLAAALATLLPTAPDVVFDPQMGIGNLMKPYGFGVARYGLDIDPSILPDPMIHSSRRLTGNCLDVWQILDRHWPDLRWQCQVANPPFGLRWKLDPPAGSPEPPREVDSVVHTWERMLARAAADGFGYMIAGRGTIERSGINTHPWVYLTLHLAPGTFEGVALPISVVFFHNAVEVERMPAISAAAAHAGAHAISESGAPASVRSWYRGRIYRGVSGWSDFKAVKQIDEAFTTVADILRERKAKRPPFHVYLNPKGKLAVNIDTETRLLRSMSREWVKRIMAVDGCHPLALVQEVETRRMLAELLSTGMRIQPHANAAIRSAIRDVAGASAPIRPVTEFQLVAYADELEQISVRPDFVMSGPTAGMAFTPGKAYPLSTRTYTFGEQFSRRIVHAVPEEEGGGMTTITHSLTLSGQDRYISITDNLGREHRFMDRPTHDAKEATEHPEALLWSVFVKPEVATIAETHEAKVRENRERLLAIAGR